MRWIRPYSSRRRVPPLCTRHALGSWLAYEMIADTQKNKQTRTDDGGVFKFGKYATPKVAVSSWNIFSHPKLVIFYLFLISHSTLKSYGDQVYPFTFLYVLFPAIESYNVDGMVLFFFNSKWDNSLEFLGYFSYPLLFFVCWLLLRVVTVTDCWQQLRYLTHVFLSRIHMRPSFLFFEAFKADVFIWPYQMLCYRVSGPLLFLFFLVGLMGLEATN